MNPSPTPEAERLRKVYADREARPGPSYSLLEPVNLLWRQERDEHLLQSLKKRALDPGILDVLDVGCGSGTELLHLLRCGFDPLRLHGVEMLESRVEIGRKLHSGLDIRHADAADLPWSADSFDLITQYTVFSSILDSSVRQKVAAEMVRVLRPGGLICWYDFRVNNPWNPDVRGVPVREIRQLFPECRIQSRQVTLLPPLARRLAPVSMVVCRLLTAVKIFNTHIFAELEK